MSDLNPADLNLAEIHECIASVIPERDCIVFRDQRLSYADVTERTRRLASFLRSRGLGCHKERADLAGWESGQDHLGLYLYNGPEYLEGMLGAYKARVAPFNVNYRYVREELQYLLNDARPRGLIYHASFAPLIAEIRADLPGLDVLIQVPDESDEALLPGAVSYEDALAAGSAERPDLEWSPDDLYMLYTGGTTGMPKGVLWRQADILVASLGGRRPDGSENTLDQTLGRARRGGHGFLPAPPLMHAAAQWAAFNQFHSGNTVLIQSNPRHLDPHDLWSLLERERGAGLLIVGDAFARPLLDQLRRADYQLDSIRAIYTGGAVTSAAAKQGLIDALPGVRIVDVLASSETGSQCEAVDSADAKVGRPSFVLRAGACVLSADMGHVVEAGSDELGWVAQAGRVPLGYFGDREKTERAFPTIGGVRYSVPGDRVHLHADGKLELLGRESVTINSGGEKVFAEEVEAAIKRHPAIYDAIVCGRPNERWGDEVVAVVRLREGLVASDDELLTECSRHLARYKWPRAFVFRDEIRRSPSGKPDYAWAREQVG